MVSKCQGWLLRWLRLGGMPKLLPKWPFHSREGLNLYPSWCHVGSAMLQRPYDCGLICWRCFKNRKKRFVGSKNTGGNSFFVHKIDVWFSKHASSPSISCHLVLKQPRYLGGQQMDVDVQIWCRNLWPIPTWIDVFCILYRGGFHKWWVPQWQDGWMENPIKMI